MAQEQWQVAGNASEIYEQHLVPAYFDEWAEILLGSTAIERGSRVLDVACGTGIVGRKAAQIVGDRGKVVGLDLNPGMLAVARKESEAVSAETDWREGSATEMPLGDGEFDNVYCQAGIMFFPDRPAALREMRRVLAPGGRLAASVWRSLDRTPGFAALERAIEAHVSPEAAAIVRSPFTIDAVDEFRTLVQDAGFNDTQVRLDTRMVRFPSVGAFFACYSQGSPLAGHVAVLESDDALVAQMTNDLQAYVDDDGLAFPIEGLIVTATK